MNGLCFKFALFVSAMLSLLLVRTIVKKKTESAVSVTFAFSTGASLHRPPRRPSGKASASRSEGPGFESRLCRDFSGSSHTSDLKIGTPVATLPGAWRYRVSTGTGRPGVSIL